MNLFLIFAYLFFIGATLGWCLELVFRRFFSNKNKERKWINPGFCIGPYLPLYGFGLCIMYGVSSVGLAHRADDSAGSMVLLLLGMGAALTLIEYIAGIVCLDFLKVRLWDYTDEPLNIRGVICLRFSLAWTLLSTIYLLGVHRYILDGLWWLSENLAFSFVIGFFFGVFSIDVVYSAHLIARLKAYAEANDVIVRYESLKAHMRDIQVRQKERIRFLFPLPQYKLTERLRSAYDALEKVQIKVTDKIQNTVQSSKDQLHCPARKRHRRKAGKARSSAGRNR